MHRVLVSFGLAALLALALSGCRQEPAPEPAAPANEAAAAAAEKVVVYTARQPHLIEPLFERFEAETGIDVEFISDDAGALIERLAAEGERSPADVLITVDAGNLWQATERGLLQPLESDLLQQRIPAALRDPDGHWYGLSIRARTVVYHPDRVDPSSLSTYAALAEPEWKGRLCLRTSRKVYNQSLVAMMIERFGEQRTEDIVRGWVDNLATGPFSSDTRLIEAVAAGQCDVGLVNTYYLGRLQKDNPDYPVKLFWADQGEGGVHVNISGAGITAHASNTAGARRLIEWLAGDEAQQIMAESNLEYPVVDGVPLDPVVEAWGPFERDPTNIAIAGMRQSQAVRLMDRSGWR